MIWIVIVILALTYLYHKIINWQNQWTRRDVKQKPQQFLLGDSGEILLRKKSVYDAIVDLYNEFPEER